MRITIDNMELELDSRNHNATVSHIMSNGDIVIPRSVYYNGNEYLINVIDSGCLYENNSVTSIKFPFNSEVEYIRGEAFSFSNLQSIVLPPKTFALDRSLFDQSKQLTSIKFPVNSKLEYIVRNSFFGATQIESLILPATVKDIDEGWCNNTPRLNKVSFFSENKHFKILDNGILLGKLDPKSDNYDVILFAPRNLKTVTIPTSVHRVGNHSFYGCKHLNSIEFKSGNDKLSIGAYAFTFSIIKKIFIPSFVSLIDSNAFADCKKLEKVVFEQEKATVNLIQKDVFMGSEVKSVIIPKSLEKLYVSAFCDCDSLLSLEFLSESIELRSIVASPFKRLSIVAFPNAKRIFFNFEKYDKYKNILFVISSGAEVIQKEDEYSDDGY